jgi:hypothetical protein
MIRHVDMKPGRFYCQGTSVCGMDVVQRTDNLARGSEACAEEAAAVQCSAAAVRVLHNTVERSVCFQIYLTC